MVNIVGMKSNAKLLQKLKQASEKKQTPQEIREQRVSFIYGSIDNKKGVTRSRIQEILAEQEGS